MAVSYDNLLFPENLKLKISFSGSKYVKNGEEYLKVDNCKVDVKIVKMKMKFENLFKTDKVLNDLGNQLVNQNVDMFIKEIEPYLQKSLCKCSV